MGSLGISPIQPQTGVDPLGGYSRHTPLDRMVPGEVTIHQLICYFPSLRMVSLPWVRRKGDRR